MQKYLNANGRLVIHDETHHTINSVAYKNDRITQSSILFHATQGIIDTLVSRGALTPYETVSIH